MGESAVSPSQSSRGEGGAQILRTGRLNLKIVTRCQEVRARGDT